ncbi:GumC family protein [Paraliomyxa miuraensis]|uniref:GumC family protein n=1 Tax=Paraliomyxa miuraensis TaxID=376150 RepID=UPI002255BDAA|nr:polysaccharide biosynthesis tyrosine autokinase [Paraliomyxa miuraensis]MCX4246343.1 polysaccharide biosynthesis tyrosine autokinase [Paraliomyxa miuraensis]
MQPDPDRLGRAAPHEGIAQLLRLGHVLRRRWLVWLAATGLCVAAAGLVLRSLPPRFRASASLVLRPTGPQVLDKVRGVVDEGNPEGKAYDAYYQTQRAIMGSRSVAERALDRLGLLDDPDALREADGPLHSAPPTADAVERLQRLVSIEEVRGSRVVAITAEHPDPERARDLANAMADAYLDHVREGRHAVGRRAQDDLAQERKAARERLDQAEQALRRFKDDNGVTSVSLADRQNVITSDVLTLSARAKEAEAERIALGSVLQQAERRRDEGDMLAALLVLADGEPTLERLRAEHVDAKAAFRAADLEYGPKHTVHQEAAQRLKEAEKALDREVRARLSSLDAKVAAARRTEQSLAAAVAREQGRALALGGLEQRHHELARDARTAEEEYLVIARRDTEVGLTNRVEEEGIELLDRATVPAVAAFPHRGVGLGLGATAGLLLGLVLALVVEARDQRIRDVVDLERALAEDPLPVLGQLPALTGDRGGRRGDPIERRRSRDLHVHRSPGSLAAERCRGIRTSLAFVQGGASRCLMVTSPAPSEGKSSVATSLALSLCQARKSVVLIDADLRRPRLHTVFGDGEESSRGLAAVLRGEAELDEVIVRGPAGAPENLHVIPCGLAPEHPTELLESAAMNRVLDELRDRYDVVLLDSPPVLPVADPLVLAQVVDGVVVVARSGKTARGELLRAVELLRRADARVLGVVLNEVDESGRRDGYGGYGYGGYVTDERDGLDDGASSAA